MNSISGNSWEATSGTYMNYLTVNTDSKTATMNQTLLRDLTPGTQTFTVVYGMTARSVSGSHLATCSFSSVKLYILPL